MMTNKAVVKDVKERSKAENFPVQDHKSITSDYAAGLVSDEEIDQNYKIILRAEANGAYLSPEIVAHLEYFVNTLTLKHRSKIINPFQKAYQFPALLFKGVSRVESFSNGTGPTQPEVSSESEEDNCGVAGDIIDEPTLTQQLLSKSAENKDKDAKAFNASRRVSIKDEVARQSSMFLARMSVMQKSRLLTRPAAAHFRDVRASVRRDKTSILSSVDSNRVNACPIDQKSIQERIMRKSIRMVLPNADRSFVDGKLSQK